MNAKQRLIDWLLGYKLKDLLNNKNEIIDSLHESHESSCNLWIKQIEMKNQECLALKAELEFLGIKNRNLVVRFETEENKNRNHYLTGKILKQNIDSLREKLALEEAKSELLSTDLLRIKNINKDMVRNMNKRGKK